MMTILNQEIFNQHLDARSGGKHSKVYELLLPILLAFKTYLVFCAYCISYYECSSIHDVECFAPSTKQNQLDFINSKQSIKVIDLITIMGFIGVLTIWTAKISVFYALFLVFAIFAFNRLEHRFDSIDTIKKIN